MAKHKTIKFGSGRRWLNPKSLDCKAAIIWSVELTVYEESPHTGERTSYLEAHMDTTDETGSHWVYERGALAPIVVMINELEKFKVACKAAFDYAEEHKLDLKGY